MWLAVLMLAAMASGSTCPDGCQCRSPRVECRGHAPYVSQLDELPSEFNELAIRDVADYKELNRMESGNSSFLDGLKIMEVTNVSYLDDWDYMRWLKINKGIGKTNKISLVPNVFVLNCSHNTLKYMTTYGYSEEFTPHTRLRVLDLGYNQLDSIRHEEFEIHKNLMWLSLTNNEINEIELNSFNSLESLEYLDLSNNNLHTLHEILNPLTSLQRLFLAGNKLENIGSTWFVNLPKLVELDVSRNKLVLIPPDALKPLTSLSILRIDHNPLINKNFSQFLKPKKQFSVNTPILERIRALTIPAPCFTTTTITTSTTITASTTTASSVTTTKSSSYKCPKYCQCRSPRVECYEHVPKSIKTFNELPDDFTELVLRNVVNQEELLNMRSENSSFLNRLLLLEVTNVSTLDNYRWLDWNISSSFFIRIPDVLTLNLSHNSLKDMWYPEGTSNHLNLIRQLCILDLGHNNMNKLENRFHFPKLTWLNLANNRIDYIDPNSLQKLTSLEYLDLSNNNLHTLQEVFNQLISLQRLFLVGNKLEHIGSTWFENLAKLVELDVSRNKLTFILADPLQPLASLSVLKLAENPLIKRDLSLLLSTGKRLEIVDASRIGLIRVPAALTHSIRLLRLAGNQLTSINSGDFDSYPLLRELDLSDNRLVSIEEDALGRLDNLEDLNLSGNILSTIPKSLPNGLKTLDLSQNALSNLKVNDLQNLRLLTELNLSGNVITEIEGGFFRQLTVLKTLDISDNPFVKLPSDTLNGPSNLIVLRMSGLTSLKTEENQNQDTAFPFLTPENLVKLDVSRSSALAAQLLADNAALSACKSLRELDLAYTSISSIRSDLAYVLPQLERLNLLGNDWNCSEDQFWLGEWIRQHNGSAEFSARCKIPSQYEGKLLVHVGNVTTVKNNRMSSSIVSPATTISSETDSASFTTDAPRETSESTTKLTTTTQVTTTKTKNPREESTTQFPATRRRKLRNSSTTSNEKESINLSTVTYAKEVTSDASTMESTQASAQSTTQTNTMKNNQNKRPLTTEATLVFSTVANRSNKKEARSVYNTAPLTQASVEETTKNPASSASPSTTTHATPSSTEAVLLTKLKQSTSVKFEESTASPKPTEVKADVPVHEKKEEEEEQQQPKLAGHVFSEFSHSKLLFANDEPSSSSSSSSSSNSFAEELRNSQPSESNARTSESLASGAHPGMLVLLGAAIVAAAALTVVLSRRATVNNRRERLYQRHENIEVHALTPTTTELW